MDGIANLFDVWENHDSSKYDHFIIGGSIGTGQKSPQLKEYIKMNKELIKEKIRALFAVCGNDETCRPRTKICIHR